MTSVPDEPVRGVIGNVGALKFNGMAGSRGFIRGEIAPPPIHHLLGLRPTKRSSYTRVVELTAAVEISDLTASRDLKTSSDGGFSNRTVRDGVARTPVHVR